MNNTDFIHPESKKDIIKEFHRLRKKYPLAEADSLMAMSRDYVWTLCLGDTLLINQVIGIQNGKIIRPNM